MLLETTAIFSRNISTLVITLLKLCVSMGGIYFPTPLTLGLVMCLALANGMLVDEWREQRLKICLYYRACPLMLTATAVRYTCPGLSFGLRKMSKQYCSKNLQTCSKWPADTWKRSKCFMTVCHWVLEWLATQHYSGNIWLGKKKQNTLILNLGWCRSFLRY